MEDLFDDGAPVSDKARAFVTELAALCVRHGVQLSVSDYDSLQLWPLEDPQKPIHAPCIEDRTGRGGGPD
jgi:hypothetical protein